MVFFAGFASMLLAGVLLLTEVWGYSVTHAGVALVPGPAMAATFAAPAGRLTGRFGPRPVVFAGGLVFAAGFFCCWRWSTRPPTTPAASSPGSWSAASASVYP